MKRKKQSILTWIIISLVGIGLLGGTFYGGWQALSGVGNTTNQADRTEQGYQSQIASLSQQAQQKTDDASIQLALGDAYFDYGSYLLQNNKEDEGKAQFKLAVPAYQKYLAKNENISAYTDMATAAFYAGENDVADAGFKKALSINPKYYQALYNYAIFLAQGKSDYSGAVNQLTAAINVAPSQDDAQSLMQMISQLQSEAQAKSKSDAVDQFNANGK